MFKQRSTGPCPPLSDSSQPDSTHTFAVASMICEPLFLHYRKQVTKSPRGPSRFIPAFGVPCLSTRNEDRRLLTAGRTGLPAGKPVTSREVSQQLQHTDDIEVCISSPQEMSGTLVASLAQ